MCVCGELVHATAPCLVQCKVCFQPLCPTCAPRGEHQCVEGSDCESPAEKSNSADDGGASSDASAAVDELATLCIIPEKWRDDAQVMTVVNVAVSRRWGTIHRFLPNATASACGFPVSVATHEIHAGMVAELKFLCRRPGCFAILDPGYESEETDEAAPSVAGVSPQAEVDA